jgi:hypothetical protein
VTAWRKVGSDELVYRGYLWSKLHGIVFPSIRCDLESEAMPTKAIKVIWYIGTVLVSATVVGCNQKVSDVAPAYYVSPSGTDSNSGAFDSPFASLIKAQAAMRSSDVKTTYVRAGTYSDTSLTLTTADNGETWSYYPGDGYDTAILDGGATSGDTGENPVTILGGSNITLNGLTIRNFPQWGVGIHGGNSAPSSGYPYSVATADSISITNNIIQNGYTTAEDGWSGGGIWAKGQVTNLTVANNVVANQYGSGIRVGSNGDLESPNDNISGLVVKNNVLLMTDRYPGDNGSIYVEDQNFVSTNMLITSNFIRDYQSDPSIRNSNPITRDVAIYLDRGASNVTVTANIIANTAYAIVGSAEVTSTQAFFIGSGHNDTVSGNIIDLGDDGYIMNLGYIFYYATDPAMTGNAITGNIFMGNWSGTQESYAFGVGPVGYASSGQSAPAAPICANNMYYNYGGGSMSTNGNEFNDASPVVGDDPLISGWKYTLAANSSAYDAPVKFPVMVGGWGPPGYVIPDLGTPPSYAETR